MTQDITQIGQGEASFRGIKAIYAIPFKVKQSIQSTDERAGKNLELPQKGIPKLFGPSAESGDFAGLVSQNNSHLYKSVIIPRGTASMLIYGQAIDEDVDVSSDSVAFKRRNGVLRKHGVETGATPSDISFTLEPFITPSNEVAFNTTVNGLLSYLNSITAASVSLTGYTRSGSGGWGGGYTYTQHIWSYSWSNPSDYSHNADLENPFVFLTNDGIGFSAGTMGLNKMLTSLYNSLYTLANDTSAGGNDFLIRYYASTSGYNNPEQSYYYLYHLSRKIRELINNSEYVDVTGSGANVTVTLKAPYTNFPDSYGVPAGCVAFQWNGNAFVQQTPSTGSSLAPMDAYCYPPCLWYIANSTVRTSDDSDIVDQYISTNTTWQSICDQYTYGTVVLPGVASAAVKDPLNYGVAMMEINLNYAQVPGSNDHYLNDSRPQAIDVGGDSFPLTGIIVGEQKNQKFNFSPMMGGTSMYVYDSDVNDGSTPKAYIAHSSSGLTFKPIHTLVVQTEDANDVHLALEFQNNSGADFYGANANKIPAGSKFYLLATLEYANAVNNSGETLTSVFVHDRITRVNLDIQSLAKAYNTIPELRDPQLEIGVVTQMEWVQATPSEIPMY